MKHSIAEDWRNGGFALYVHWPFCTAKCPYCDFNSHVVSRISHADWREAYLREIDRWAEITSGRVLTSIFFGGGTPSLMQPETVAAVINAAKSSWHASNNLEVTLEANPTSVDFERFQGFSDAGVNRLSLGVQALNDADLAKLGRLHSVEEAMKAWEIANSVFSRTSLDLIYARQHQTAEDWDRELATALALKPSHMSLYQLTIEPGTAFGDRHARGRLGGLPSEDLGADLWQITQDQCNAAGLTAYEVSNHAFKGLESQHNLVYWRYGDYVGIGPGAHGRVTTQQGRIASVAARQPGDWLSKVNRQVSADEISVLTIDEQADELLLMGLRLSEGIDLERYTALRGSTLRAQTLSELSDMGLIWRDGTRMGATETGRPLLNSLLRELL
ncbi:radical SAM family heme chaperone HemW [Rhodobacter sp. NTK016B]|uniref:radical SAM family heme chaperone HemW n=1 Tax=Rhodobacter sp. NTK016B TaxID=2759676 RepID=UPI0032E51096